MVYRLEPQAGPRTVTLLLPLLPHPGVLSYICRQGSSNTVSFSALLGSASWSETRRSIFSDKWEGFRMNYCLYQHNLLSRLQQIPTHILLPGTQAIPAPTILKSRLLPHLQKLHPGFLPNRSPQSIPGSQPAQNGENWSRTIHSGSHAINVACSHSSMDSAPLANSLACLGSIPKRSPKSLRSFENKI